MDGFNNHFDNIMQEIEIPQDLEDLIDSYFQDLDVYVSDDPKKGITELHTLRAKKDAPKGTGTRFMTQLCNWADKNKRILVLQTATKEKSQKGDDYKNTSSQNRLKKFYGRFGFVSNYGKKTYRSDLRGNLHRNPK